MHSMPLQSPPKGMHRYVFLLYKQHGRVNASNPKSRANWTLHQFAQVFSILESTSNSSACMFVTSCFVPWHVYGKLAACLGPRPLGIKHDA